MLNCSLKISNYKCFGEEPEGFDKIADVNIVVGRNNTGKSALLDIVELATRNQLSGNDRDKHKGEKPQLLLGLPLDAKVVKSVFSEGNSGQGIPGRNFWEYGKHYVNSEITIALGEKVNSRLLKIADPDGIKPLLDLPAGEKYGQGLASAVKNPFEGRIFKRIFAERNIVPEIDSKTLSIDGRGKGITNLIQNFINKVHLDSSAIERQLLDELNNICSPDSVFTDIVCQQLHDGSWEIFLEEKHKGRIALSSTGSGLKTIILALCYVLLLPTVENRPLSEFIFAFEELENNLHPALLRRLIGYLLKATSQHQFLLFLTTHSNVMIDVFNKLDNAQIIHVTHDGNASRAKIRGRTSIQKVF